MNGATLSKVMGGRLSQARYNQLAPVVNQAMIRAGCTTVRRAAMFLAQVGHESGGLLWMQELASGAAYEGRKDLGNTHPGDGRRFKGRGPIQITGRYNYTGVSVWAYKHGYTPSKYYFITNPTHLAWDKYAFLGPVWYWTIARPKLNSYADKGNIRAATLAVNGGTKGLAARTAYWHRALRYGKAILPTGVAKAPTTTKKSTWPLAGNAFFGLKGVTRSSNIAKIQKKLGGLTTDGIFGTRTAAKVISFQRSHGLAADGKVGPKTWARLGL